MERPSRMPSWLLRAGILLLLTTCPFALAAAEQDAFDWDPATAPVPGAGRDVAAAAKNQPGGGDRSRLMVRLLEQSQPLRATAAPSLQRQRLSGMRAPAALHAVAIMVEFADTCFYGRQDLFPGPLPTSTQSSFYYAAHDSVYYDHLLRDVADYYTAASGGRFTFDFTVHGRVVQLAEGMAFYGNHPEFGEQPFQLASDAVAALDEEIDFASYDSVILIHAGAGQETDVLRNSPEQIYSTYLGPDAFGWAVEDSLLAVPYLPSRSYGEGDGIRHILILPENQFQDPYEGFSGHFGSLGTYCFVVGLRLGMLSLSDFTPAGAPDSQGVGQFCLMGYGLFSAGGYIPPQPCAFNKQLMGWIDPLVVDPELAATWTVLPAARVGHPLAAARIDLTGAEYFLLEYRLQDPDGNGIFSFDGDLNGNNVPDFFDASNAANGGVPSRFFDPATDVRERLVGAEWDFFLSDNSARPPGVKGAGSGLYIWHVDEGVIRDAFGRRQNLFNANPQRKSVDLEEADGIQDLDSRQPSPYWLGGDDDSFRGEGNDMFGPDTRPDTATNGGVRTGLVIDQISRVVEESVHVFHAGTDSAYTGILYFDAMTFRCWRESATSAAAAPLAARDLPGVDMTGSHLMVVSLAGDPAGGPPVFVAAADSGRVYAWTADLAEWVDRDDDPATFEPLAVGTDARGRPVSWLLPAAAGAFIPGGAGLQIVLGAPGGLYAFDHDGTPLGGGPRDLDRGLIAALPVLLPPVLLPSPEGDDPLAPVVACVVTGERTAQRAADELRFLDHSGQDVAPAVRLPGRVLAPPVHADGILYIAIEKPSRQGALAAVSWSDPGPPSVTWHVDLDLLPSAHPPLVAPPLILMVSPEGRGQTVRLSAGAAEVLPPWPQNVTVAGPLGAGGACGVEEGAFGRIGAGGAWQTGWPQRPAPAIRASGTQPLAFGGPDGAGADALYHLFATRDGRLYLTDAAGGIQPGWPIAGPADLLATPAVVRLPAGDGGDLVLMTAGTTPQITGLGAAAASQRSVLQTRMVTRLRSWRWPAASPDVAVAAAGAMYGGSPRRGGAVGSLALPPAEVPADLAASHICYPQPLTGDVLWVRGLVARDGSARAVILNLQGERVRDTGDVAVLGGAPFDLQLDMGGVASGVYLCRLQAGGMSSVRRVAITR